LRFVASGLMIEKVRSSAMGLLLNMGGHVPTPSILGGA
jgi:hypothetical protein